MTDATDINAPGTNALVHRLAIQRLVAPGILDQRKLQRVHEKFSRPSRAPMLDRLFRCVEPVALHAKALPVVRVDRSAEVGTPSVTNHIAASATASETMGASDTRVAASSVSSFVGDRLARQSSGVVNAPSVGLIDIRPTSARALARVVEAGDGSRSAAHGAVSGLVQRAAETVGFSAASDRAIAARQVSPTAPSSLMVFRHADPAAASRSGRAAPHVTTTNVAQAAAADRPTASQHVDPVAASGTGRAATHATAADVVQASKPVLSSAPGTAAKNVTASFVPLLFRKPNIAALAAQVATQAPAITPAAAGVISRAAAVPEKMSGEPGRVFAAADVPMDIDWITQQVSSRLERRLEIERERLGVRRWRQ